MKTQVENTSGESKYYNYLPGHGRVMTAGEVIDFDGDLRSVIASGRGRYSRAADLAALDADCLAGTIAITELVEECAGSSSSA